MNINDEKILKYSREKDLIVFTKYFGYNFTGATITTHELVNEWKHYFRSITVITRNIGKYQIEGINIIKARNIRESIQYAKELNTVDKIFYTDDHTASILSLFKIPYYHTYHASWPKAKYVDFKYFIKSFGFIPLYKRSIKHAKSVITVSYYSRNFTQTINKNTVVIRNGIGLDRIKNIKKFKDDDKKSIFKIIMIGNIDKNKYIKALYLFNEIKRNNLDVEIDVYGKIINSKLAEKISKYEFVKLKGFRKDINLNEYDLFISTSKFENLSISVCEAINLKLPVIAFDIGGLNEVIINGENGFLIEKYNTLKMYKFISLIKENPNIFTYSIDSLDKFKWNLSAKLYVKEFIYRRV